MKITVGTVQKPTQLIMGGTDRDGNRYGVNNRYLTKNERPVLPVMGEFHFSRWTPEEWEESILKMRAGGVNILATYVFWIHHEEKKGEWNFKGSRDIHAFLEVCRKLKMPVWLRIGPWAHGECRNGGFPDWLVQELGHNGLGAVANAGGKIREARTNDELYLEYVNKFWSRLARETRGEMCRDGGPVIGIQLENEYCHAGGPADKEQGAAHMKTLKEMALSLGFVTPYYTATGWGGAIVLEGETLPVLGGYVDAPWAGHRKEMPASENFLLVPFREDENIGADLSVEDKASCTFSKEKNPYLTAELGGGLQVTAHRRTYPFGTDTQAQALCMLGAGANLLGYYMYHGGFNPDGKYSTLQESRETGYYNDLPVKSYDFQACIRESGRINESYHKLKMLHLLIQQFTDSLAPAVAYFPEEKPVNAEDMTTPRISVRFNHDTREGFLFINNHQRLRQMQQIQSLTVEVETEGKKFVLHDISCATDACAVIPFGLKMGESRLLATNASLLTRIGTRYFFYRDGNDSVCEEGRQRAIPEAPYFEYEDVPYDNVTVLTAKEAEHAYVFDDKLYITPNSMFEQDGVLYMLAGEQEQCVRFYEESGEPVDMYVLPPEIMTHVSIEVKDLKLTKPPEYALQSALEQESHQNECRVYDLKLTYDKILDEYADEEAEDLLHEIYLTVEFGGNRAQLYRNGQLLTDWFSNGEDWTVALKRYGYPENLQLVIYPFEENVYYDLPPGKGCGLNHITAQAEYKLEV